MEFQFTEEQQLVRKTMREFAETEVAAIARRMDQEDWWPTELVPRMAELGLMGMTVPTELGGTGLDTVSYNIAIEEIARVSGSLSLSLAAHNGLGISQILSQGNEAQLAKYMPDLASGKKIGAWALTEPTAGSDAASLQTTAKRDGDGWLINGQKQFITNGHIADVFTIMAKTDPAAGTKGITAFVAEAGAKGLGIGAKEDKLGMRGSITSQLYFEDLWVPDENMLGKEGHGFIGALKTLDAGRIAIGSLSLGLAQGAFDRSVDYAKERQQFGAPIGAFQAVQWKLADMATEIDAARLLLARAANRKDQGLDFKQEASMAKLYASEMATRVCREAIQIHGGNGYVQDYDVERMLRDNKLCEIGEGSSEVQRMVIARGIGVA
ncbi:MAG: acyl-CoA dehydrogenase family protein [Thermoplasmatota archaeon]